jgi:Lipocalin-like domain
MMVNFVGCGTNQKPHTISTIMKRLFYSLALIGLALLSSCGKYDDGPAFSLASKKSRISGEWHVSESISTSTPFGTFGISINEDLTVNKDGSFTWKYDDNNSGFSISGTETGNWDFSSDKESVHWTFSDGSTDNTKILKLTKKELWMERKDDDGTTYEIHFDAK